MDFDGTLAEYTTWQGVEHLGAPVPAMVERVKAWVEAGREVRIFTARVWFNKDYSLRSNGTVREVLSIEESRTLLANYPMDRPDLRKWVEAHMSRALIQRWCREHLGFELAVTNVKDPFMAELWDDRCVQVAPNTGERWSPTFQELRGGGPVFRQNTPDIDSADAH